jgi:hypothetical protein
MILAVREKPSDRKATEDTPTARLSPMETEVIDLFVQLSRLLGHPCKICIVLNLAAPVLFIGPRPSHLSEIVDSISKQYPCASAAHGELDRVVQLIQRFRQQSAAVNRQAPPQVCARFAKEALLPQLIAALVAG